MRKLIFIIVFCSFALTIIAQYRFDRPVIYTKEDGLPGNRVRVVENGKNGFIWIGTNEGLSRFDGQEFRNYQTDLDDPQTLSTNSINTVLPEKSQVWVGHQGGLSVLNLVTEKFTNYQITEKGKLDSLYMDHGQAVHAFLRDKDDVLWVGTRYYGFGKYLPEKDDFMMFNYDDPEPEKVFNLGTGHLNIFSIKEDLSNDSTLWVGTLSGLYEFNKYTYDLKWHHFPQPGTEGLKAKNAIRHLNVHDDGKLYYGTWSGGVNVFDPETRTFSSLPVKPGKSRELLPLTANIAEIKRKSKDELWIKHSHIIIVYNINTLEATEYARGHLKKPIGLTCIDDKNRIWAKSNKGLLKFDPLLQQFPHYSFEDQSGVGDCYVFDVISSPDLTKLNIVSRSCNGFYQFDLETKTWTKHNPPAYTLNKYGDFNGRGVTYLEDDLWLISYYRGIIAFNPENGKFSSAPFKAETKNDAFGPLFKDSNKNVWWCTDFEGILRWNGTGNSAETFLTQLYPPGSEIPSTRTYRFLEDSQKNIWFNRKDGMTVYIPEKDTFLNFINTINPENSFPYIYDFGEDRYGRVWMAGHAGWIGYAYAKRPEEGVIEKIYVYSKTETEILNLDLRSDPNGDIWILASKELIKIDATTLNRTSFDLKYGADETDLFSFNVLPTGEIVFGTRFGIMIAHPDNLKRNEELPIPYLTGIEVKDKPLQLPTTLSTKVTLDLNPHENFFSFGFSAKSYTLSKFNKFRYRMLGFQENWTDAKGRRFANYTNVPSGGYTFQLQAANNEGIWNGDIFEAEVNIKTPWWNTMVAKIIGLVIIAGFIYSVYWYRVNQIRRQAKMKTEFEKQLASVEMSALRAQMNPHFLFNCLNSIERFVIKNEVQKASEYLNNFARLIRLILQNSRSNYIILKDELEALELYMGMEALRFGEKFDYEVIVGEEVDVDSISIPPMLFQPYVENAIWHGLMAKKEKGKVELRLNRKNGLLSCIIDDNGIGREKAQELKSKNQRKNKKSMGMSITKNRIEMINKLYDTNTSIEIIDKKDKEGNGIGTRVELNIPV